MQSLLGRLGHLETSQKPCGRLGPWYREPSCHSWGGWRQLRAQKRRIGTPAGRCQRGKLRLPEALAAPCSSSVVTASRSGQPMCHGFSLGTTRPMTRSDVIATAPSASPITRGAAANSLHLGTASDMRLPGSGWNMASWTCYLAISIPKACSTSTDLLMVCLHLPHQCVRQTVKLPGSRPGAAAEHGAGTRGRSSATSVSSRLVRGWYCIPRFSSLHRRMDTTDKRTWCGWAPRRGVHDDVIAAEVQMPQEAWR